MAYEIEDFVVDVFPWAVCIGAVVLIGGLVLDSVQERRAFSAITACEVQRQLPRRQSFSTRVVCVPNPSRRDTTGVEVINR